MPTANSFVTLVQKTMEQLPCFYFFIFFSPKTTPRVQHSRGTASEPSHPNPRQAGQTDSHLFTQALQIPVHTALYALPQKRAFSVLLKVK